MLTDKVATILGVPSSTMRRRLREVRIKGVKNSRTWLIHKDEVNRVLEESKWMELQGGRTDDSFIGPALVPPNSPKNFRPPKLKPRDGTPPPLVNIIRTEFCQFYFWRLCSIRGCHQALKDSYDTINFILSPEQAPPGSSRPCLFCGPWKLQFSHNQHSRVLAISENAQ